MEDRNQEQEDPKVILKQQLQNAFTSAFKYDLNQELRHRGDGGKHSADMGVWVHSRCIVQEMADTEVVFKRLYQCRLIKFSGSGEMATFNENELMTVTEWNEKHMEEENEREAMRQEMNQITKMIFKEFNVERFEEIRIAGEGDKIFKVSGFKGEKGKYQLIVREQSGLLIPDKESRSTVDDPKLIIKLTDKPHSL